MVTVPVLSSTTVSTAREDSSAWYLVMKMPSCAPRPQATISAAGVASPSAHGQAMISTASAALNARSAGLPASSHPASVRADATRTAGTKMPQIRSASRWMAAFCDWACSTRATRWASWVSRPTLTARTTSRPATTTVPAVTSVALGDVGRDGLPGHHAGVHRGLAELHLPVGGDPFPRAHHEPLPRAQFGDRDPVLGPVSVQDARVPGARRGQLPHRVPGVAPCLGLIQPARQQERRHRRGDLQVDPAAGRMQQQVGKAQPALATVQDEHRIHRPAARRGDAQRHQGVHRRPSRAGRSASAAAWNGHADHTTTGAATAIRTHCQPGNRDHGNSDSSTDRSVSGTNSTSATISRRRRSATTSASPPRSGWLLRAVSRRPARAAIENLSAVTGLLDRVDELLDRNFRRCRDNGGLGREIHGGRDTVNSVEFLLDPGRARRAGHPLDRQLHLLGRG